MGHFPLRGLAQKWVTNDTAEIVALVGSQGLVSLPWGGGESGCFGRIWEVLTFRCVKKLSITWKPEVGSIRKTEVFTHQDGPQMELQASQTLPTAWATLSQVRAQTPVCQTVPQSLLCYWAPFPALIPASASTYSSFNVWVGLLGSLHYQPWAKKTWLIYYYILDTHKHN